MLAVERRNLILEKLQEDKKVIVSELSQEFQVSEETIRRDLDKLDKDGLAVKSYGGAVLNENTSLDMPFNIRKKNNPAGKQKIAKIVETLIEDGDHIILDPSTTAVFIAKALKAKERLTVITNSIEVILELSDVSDWNIISSGGSLKEGYLALVGPRAIKDWVPSTWRRWCFPVRGWTWKKELPMVMNFFPRQSRPCSNPRSSVFLRWITPSSEELLFPKSVTSTTFRW